MILALAVLMAASPALAAKVGEPAPAFTITTFDGQTVALESLRGKVVVLTFWASWCAACRAELPAMDNYRRRHDAAHLAIFAIATEDSLPEAKLRPLASGF